MSSNQQAAPRVSILVGAGESSERSGSESRIGSGLRVRDRDRDDTTALASTTRQRGGMSPGSEDMAAPSSENPTPIPADEGDVSKAVQRVGVVVAGLDGDGEDGVVDRVTPREGDAVNVTRDDNADEDPDDEEEGDDNGEGEEEDVADDESDYSYAYEDEDEGHYSGFLIPTEPVESNANHHDGSSASLNNAAGGNDDSDLVAAAPADAAPSNGAAARGGGLPRTISRAASGLSGSSSPVPETNPGERKPRWREPSRAAVNMSLRAEKETTGGRRRLAQDLYKIMRADTAEAGFSLEPCDEDSMDKWCIKLFGFDADANLAKDLLVCGMDHVELQMSFPDQYPFAPPFVQVVRPRFKRQTGFVMSGALCMELLTRDGWNPINDIESVIVSIRSLMVVGDGRLQTAVALGKEAYGKALAAAQKKEKSQKRAAEEEGEHDDDDEDGDNEAMGGETKRKRAPSGDEGETAKNNGKKAPAARGGTYSTAEAQSAYDHLTSYHKKEGWDKSGWWSRKG